VKARSNIAYITKTQVNTQGSNKTAQQALINATRREDNYLTSVINNGKVVHWDVYKMPLLFYISDALKFDSWHPR